MEEANLAQYVRNSSEWWLLKKVAEMDLVSCVETGEKRDTERKTALREKALHGKFFTEVDRLTEEGGVDYERSWQ